jgi:hypothetical protein
VSSPLAGRKVQIRRPRVRAESQRAAIQTFEAFADTDALNHRVAEQMLIGVATRQYGRSLEPTGAAGWTRGTNKSAVRRRFVAKATGLDALDLVTLLIDDLHVGSTASSSLASTQRAQNTRSASGTSPRRMPRGQRPRRIRRDAHRAHARSVRSPAPVTRNDQCDSKA